MISTKSYRVFLFVLLFAFMSITAAQVTLAQDSNESQRPSANAPHVDYNFDAELYLVLASNQRSGEGQLPASLDQVVKQLRATLPFKNYSLAATLDHPETRSSSFSAPGALNLDRALQLSPFLARHAQARLFKEAGGTGILARIVLNSGE